MREILVLKSDEGPMRADFGSRRIASTMVYRRAIESEITNPTR